MRTYMRLGFLVAVATAMLFAGAGIGAAPSTTDRVSVDSAGIQGNSDNWGVAINADGRYVAFFSEASNLVPGDTNGCSDVFVHDRQTGVTERISVDSASIQGNDNSSGGNISADGRYVAFFSEASNLVPGDTSGYKDVFVHDRQTGQTTRVSVDSAGNQGNDNSSGASISADGRHVVFSSDASNLVPGDTNSCSDVFVHDRQTGITERISVDSAGNEAYFVMSGGGISADGRYVTLWSEYGDLAGDAGVAQVFVHDRDTDGDGIFGEEGTIATTRVARGNRHSVGGPISADGRYVVFSSDASNLVPGDTNDGEDVFLHDRQTGITERVSVNSAGNQGNGESSYGEISADGRYVVFSSDASNLVADDTNDVWDVFVHDRGESPTPGRLTICPPAGKWAMSVWDGSSGTPTGDALATCADVSIDAAYWLDPTTQLWWRYFPEWLGISNLLTLEAFQPIMIRGR